MRGTKREAEEALNRLLLEIGAGRELLSGFTLGDLLDQWWPIKAASVSPTTRRDWESCLRLHVRPHLLERPLHKLRAADLDRLYRRLVDAGVSAPRVRRVHTVLSTALAQAVRWEMIAANPALSASPPMVRQREISPPSADEVIDFFSRLEADDEDLAVFVWLASATGARRGELCALRWASIDLEHASLLIERNIVDGDQGLVEKDTKTHQVRRLALGAATVKRLAAHRRAAQERALACGMRPMRTCSPPPWTGRFPGGRTTQRTASSPPAAATAWLTACDCMTSATSWLPAMIASGVDVRTLAGRLGHRRTSTTLDCYAAFLPAADRAAAESFEANLVASPPAGR